MTRDVGAPPAPSRARVVRPSSWRSSLTGMLAPDVRDALLGLTTLADDEGWLMWSPDEITAWLYPYTTVGRRLADLKRRAAILETAGLLVIHGCGCAYLPTMKEQHGIKGGRPTAQIWNWHYGHVPPRAPTDSHPREGRRIAPPGRGKRV
jgi:hypothetical protein